MCGKTILVVDDEMAIRSMLRLVLEAASYRVCEAESARAAEVAVFESRPDLVLLDWMMPNVSGFELLKQWRVKDEMRSVPVIMLTARDSEDCIVSALDSGADDYVAKPFAVRELLARIKVCLRNDREEVESAFIRFDALQMDLQARSISVRGQPVHMGPKEYQLLEYFLTHQNRACTRNQLLDRVWGTDVYIDERTVDVHIRRLRKALEGSGYEQCIQTIRGFGYRFGHDDP